MPTAGRLAGAVIFGLFGWYMAGVSTPFFPEGNAPSFWLPASALVSLVIGWRICGSRSGRGYKEAVTVGITCAGAIAFCLVFGVAFNQMITNSLRRRYGGPMEAVVDIFDLMMEFALRFYDFQLIATLFIGGIVCALATEIFGKRFP